MLRDPDELCDCDCVCDWLALADWLGELVYEGLAVGLGVPDPLRDCVWLDVNDTLGVIVGLAVEDWV